MTITERIESMLAERGMKKKAVYDLINVSPSTYTTWVATNAASIPSEYVPAIAKLFGITCDELLTGETKIVSDAQTANLLSIYNGLSWDGQQLVIARAIEEKRREAESDSPSLARARV